MLLYQITHTTRYAYPSAALLSHHLAVLRPKELDWQRVLSFDIQTEPAGVHKHEFEDIFGNTVHYFSAERPHKELVVTATSSVLRGAPYPMKENTPTVDEVTQMVKQRKLPQDEVMPYILPSSMVEFSDEVFDFAYSVLTPQKPMHVAISDLMQKIFLDFSFMPGFTEIGTSLQDVLLHRSGVCQDFSHLAIAAFRAVGIPARYVSGYIENTPVEGMEKLEGADASHAWAQVYVPGSGWINFDPTNNLFPGDRHITVAWGRDYNDVAPLKGVIYGGGEHMPEVAVNVQRYSYTDTH